MPDGVMPLTPNPSNRFAGRAEVIAKLKRHFFTDTNNAVQKRKFILLHGMGGIGKTQICLKFVEDMSDQWVSTKYHLNAFWLPSAFLMFFGLMHPQLAPSHRHWRVSVIFLKLSPLHWMGHLNLLFTGLAYWKRTMQWCLTMLMSYHLLNWRLIFHLEEGEIFW